MDRKQISAYCGWTKQITFSLSYSLTRFHTEFGLSTGPKMQPFRPKNRTALTLERDRTNCGWRFGYHRLLASFFCWPSTYSRVLYFNSVNPHLVYNQVNL